VVEVEIKTSSRRSEVGSTNNQEETMDTPNKPARITPLNAGVKPKSPESAVTTKRVFVPSPHLMHRPFKELRVLLTPGR
jgi:hypothetical protein